MRMNNNIMDHIIQVKTSTATTHKGNAHTGKLHGEKTIIKCTVILTQHALLTVIFIIHVAPSTG